MHTNDDASLQRAIDRDLRDEERLQHIHGLITKWMDELVPDCYNLEHPKRRWSPLDLMTALHEQAMSLDRERRHYLGPVFVDECC